MTSGCFVSEAAPRTDWRLTAPKLSDPALAAKLVFEDRAKKWAHVPREKLGQLINGACQDGSHCDKFAGALKNLLDDSTLRRTTVFRSQELPDRDLTGHWWV